jgi:23S rRNA pseudouridine1911/1915/1917 synthase
MNKNFIAKSIIRLDIFLSDKLNQSRNQIEQLIKKGYVKIDGEINTKSGYKLKIGQNIQIELQNDIKENYVYDIKKLNFNIKIIFEDNYILVINKPSGLIVHQAPSVNESTLVDWLKYKNISLSTISGDIRHGIVHRLDKGTSGIMVVAKTNNAHISLSNQLKDRSMGRIYLAIIDLPLKDNIIINKPIFRDKNNRLKMTICYDNKKSRESKSEFIKLALSNNQKYELISAKLFTGRTHQIRVHLSSINRHILGDNLYGFKGELNKIKRFYLHAYNLYLVHPITNKKMFFKADIPSDINGFLEDKFNMENINAKIDKNNIFNIFNDFH